MLLPALLLSLCDRCLEGYKLISDLLQRAVRLGNPSLPETPKSSYRRRTLCSVWVSGDCLYHLPLRKPSYEGSRWLRMKQAWSFFLTEGICPKHSMLASMRFQVRRFNALVRRLLRSLSNMSAEWRLSECVVETSQNCAYLLDIFKRRTLPLSTTRTDEKRLSSINPLTARYVFLLAF